MTEENHKIAGTKLVRDVSLISGTLKNSGTNGHRVLLLLYEN